MSRPRVDLSKLIERTEVMIDGVIYRLAPVNAAMARQWEEWQEQVRLTGAKTPSVDFVLDFAAKILPDMPRELLEVTPMAILEAAMELALDPVRAAEKYAEARVEALIPNATGGEANESTVASSPTTGSATSASGSPSTPEGA